MPSVWRPPWKPDVTARVVAGSSPAWARMPPTMTTAWLTTNTMKMGASASADSRTPRMLSVMRPRMKATSSVSFMPINCGGRKLKMTSPAAAIETVIVRT